MSPMWVVLLLGAFVAVVGGVVVTVLLKIRRASWALERKNRELLALHEAAMDIYGQRSLAAVLEKVVDQAVRLIGARYGALSVVDEAGRVSQFITTGADASVEGRLRLPCGGGLLGLVRDRGAAVRIDDVGTHPSHRGFPEGHPTMTSLLAVPIPCKGPFRGGVFLGESLSGGPFGEEDEEALTRFATAAAIAIDNAHLHERLQTLAVAEERERIGREMHDGTAQLLAYVNAKAQAVRALLERGRPERAAEQLEELIGAARDAYKDVRADILDLRTGNEPERRFVCELREYLDRWRDLADVDVEAVVDPEVRLTPLVELQLTRIVQEALTNVRKHAGARRVRVELRRDNGKAVTTVRDDGRGFDPRLPDRPGYPRFGLSIMRERAESVGGTMSVESSEGAGTRVTVAVPCANPEG